MYANQFLHDLRAHAGAFLVIEDTRLGGVSKDLPELVGSLMDDLQQLRAMAHDVATGKQTELDELVIYFRCDLRASLNGTTIVNWVDAALPVLSTVKSMNDVDVIKDNLDTEAGRELLRGLELLQNAAQRARAS